MITLPIYTYKSNSKALPNTQELKVRKNLKEERERSKMLKKGLTNTEPFWIASAWA